jgi:hypothetical protein
MANIDRPDAPTLAEVERFMKLLEFEYKGQWQRDIVEFLCANPYAILQAPRQNAGKTFCVTLFAACALVKGLRVMIGTPVLRQGERILIKRIEDMLKVVERASKGKLRREIDNVQTKAWTNGAELRVVSLSEGSKAGAQGFTADILVVDEAHEVTEDVYGVVEPTLDVAAAEGRARIILLGIGGNDEVTSLIEVKKYDNDGNPSPQFRSLRLVPEDIVKCDPAKYGPFYENKEKTIMPQVWAQHYLCLPAAMGTQRVFMNLPGYVQPEWELEAPRYEFGIDVGRISDSTFCSVFEIRGDVCNLVDYWRGTGRDWENQAANICPFIYSYAGKSFPFTAGRYVKIETNGLGWGLVDEIRKWQNDNGERLFHNARGVHTSDQPPSFMKTRALYRAMEAAYRGKFGVGTNEDNPDTAARLDGLRRELLKLTYEIQEQNMHKWPHSDPLASLWVHWSQTQGAYGV